MKKHNLKTYILIALIISSVTLTGKIWFDEKLWPEGYNFFAVITDNFSFKKNNFVSSLTKETISFPQKIVVNNIEKRSVYVADSQSFSEIIPDVKELLRLALEKPETEIIPEEYWVAALKTRSLHVVYPVAYDSKLFLNILGSYHSTENSIPVREFIIADDHSDTDLVSVYIRNFNTNEVSRASIQWGRNAVSQKGNFVNRLDEIISLYAIDSIGNLSYSSELNFDKEDDATGTKQKLIIESNVLIQLNKKLNHRVNELNSLYDGTFNTDLVDGLLRHFNYNVSGAKKYVEHDNSMVYVENYSTMKFHPDGLVEYKAVDASKGVDLKAGNDFYQSLLGCVDFINVMWGNVFPSEPLNINISSNIIDTKTNTFVLTMDYFADGVEVNINLPVTTSHPGINHGIEIEVVNGKIVSYRQMMVLFESSSSSTDSMSAIEALDKLMAGTNMQGKVVKDLYPTYVTDNVPYRKCAWAVRTSDNQVTVIE